MTSHFAGPPPVTKKPNPTTFHRNERTARFINHSVVAVIIFLVFFIPVLMVFDFIHEHTGKLGVLIFVGFSTLALLQVCTTCLILRRFANTK